jgi:predicted RND superfamily exporter protein
MHRRFFDVVLQRQWLVISLSIVVIACLAAGIRLLSFSNDYRMFFSDENPQLQAFEALQNTYSKTDNVLFVITPKDGNVFTRETLSEIEWLTEQAWLIPYSIRVDSITNYQHTSADGDDLWVRNLVEDAAGLSDADLAERRKIAINEPLLVNRIISPSGHVTGVNVTIQLPGKSSSEVPEIIAFVRDLVSQVEQRAPHIEVRLTGIVVMNNAFPEQSQEDMKTLYPLMFLIILLVVGAMLRSGYTTLVTALMIFMTILATMGLSGWIGIKLSPPTTSVPVIVMTLAVADSVHILVNFLHFMRDGMEKKPAMRESLRINFMPIFLTTLTTAIGFLSLNFSDAPPFRDLGNMSAMGVTMAFILSITFLPAMVTLLPIKVGQSATWGEVGMRYFAEFVIRQRNRLFWGMIVVITVLVAQLPRNELNDVFVEYFDESIAFRADTDYAADNLTGIYVIEYSIPAPADGGVTNPEFLQHVENFANWYRSQPQVMNVHNITDIMKRLNKNLHADDPAWYKLPQDKALSAQYLLLYEFSLPFGLDLTNQINVQKTATRMTVTMRTTSTEELLEVERMAQAWLADNTPDYFKTAGTSPTMMFANIGHRNIRSMLQGTTVALVLISAILIVALRSVHIGLISIIPNLLPIAAAFGLWGMFIGQVGLALSVVSGVTLGIVVDDTVHFLSKYLRAQREKGLSAQDAVRYAFSTVGTALWVTSLVLVLGFGILALSNFELNAGMGLLTAITIALALIVDFLFLPTLLMKFGVSHEATIDQPVDRPT